MSKQALGKGLGALIPGNENKSSEQKKFITLTLDRIVPNPHQPRQDFDEENLNALAQSLKTDGMMQPLVVRANGSEYTIVAGERRYRAATLAGINEVPAVVMNDISDGRMLELALIENLQREDLNPMETAEAYHRLLSDFDLTQNQLSEKVGKSRTAVANTLRLNNLPLKIKEMIRAGRLSEGHARAIMQLGTEAQMMQMATRIVTESLSVREVEQTAQKKKKRRLIPVKKIPALVEIENYLKRLLGTSVKIKAGLKRGRIEIEYYNDEDLERLLELFKKVED